MDVDVAAGQLCLRAQRLEFIVLNADIRFSRAHRNRRKTVIGGDAAIHNPGMGDVHSPGGVDSGAFILGAAQVSAAKLDVVGVHVHHQIVSTSPEVRASGVHVVEFHIGRRVNHDAAARSTGFHYSMGEFY